MKLLAVALGSLVLVACGGGGGDSGVSPITFPMQSAYKSFVKDGLPTTSFAISGDCTGSGTRAATAATPATFEGAPGYSATSTMALNFTNCTPSTSLTSTVYFDGSYAPLGFANAGDTGYGVYRSNPPVAIPSSVTVGATGVVGTQDLYADSTKTTPNGHVDLSYVVEPLPSSGTVIVNLIAKVYDTAGVLVSTEQDRYLIGSTGLLTPYSIDIDYASGAVKHLRLLF